MISSAVRSRRGPSTSSGPPIEAAARSLVDRLVAEGSGDLVECLAFPLPMEVTRLLFGVDPADWDASVVALFDPRRRVGSRLGR